jgi:DNA-binding NarL/FixJ family response regulator
MLADDDPVILSALAQQLGHAFEFVPSASNADEAVKLAAEHRPDLALIDVVMPGGGALDAVRRLAVDAPDVALVVLSADESPRMVSELLSVGAMAYVRKGTSSEELAGTLMAALEAKSAGN